MVTRGKNGLYRVEEEGFVVIAGKKFIEDLEAATKEYGKKLLKDLDKKKKK